MANSCTCDLSIHQVYNFMTKNVKPRSHEGLGPCYDLCKTSHVVKSQVNLIRARDRSYSLVYEIQIGPK